MNMIKLAAVTAVLGYSLGQAFATPIPLNHPQGLATDSKGILYVANPGTGAHPKGYRGNTGGQVLAYNTNFTQMPTKTLSGPHVNFPISLAVNSTDQLYVLNAGDWSVRAYSAGVEDTTKGWSFDIDSNPLQTYVVYSPVSISIDGMDNLWVSNGWYLLNSFVSVMSPSKALIYSQQFPGEQVASIATSPRGSAFLESSVGVGTRQYSPIGDLLAGRGAYKNKTWEATAITIDKTGKAYVCATSGAVLVRDVNTGSSAVFASLGYAPSGVAVDNVHNRVYFANEGLNQIDVYSTQGAYINTIH